MDWEALFQDELCSEKINKIEEKLLTSLNPSLQTALDWELVYWSVSDDNWLVMTVTGNRSPFMVTIAERKPEILEKLQALAGDKVRVEVEAV